MTWTEQFLEDPRCDVKSNRFNRYHTLHTLSFDLDYHIDSTWLSLRPAFLFAGSALCPSTDCGGFASRKTTRPDPWFPMPQQIRIQLRHIQTSLFNMLLQWSLSWWHIQMQQKHHCPKQMSATIRSHTICPFRKWEKATLSGGKWYIHSCVKPINMGNPGMAMLRGCPLSKSRLFKGTVLICF